MVCAQACVVRGVLVLPGVLQLLWHTVELMLPATALLQTSLLGASSHVMPCACSTLAISEGGCGALLQEGMHATCCP